MIGSPLPMFGMTMPQQSLASRFLQASQNINGMSQPPALGGHPWANHLLMASQNMQGTPPWAPVQQQVTAPASPTPDPFIQMLQKLIGNR